MKKMIAIALVIYPMLIFSQNGNTSLDTNEVSIEGENNTTLGVEAGANLKYGKENVFLGRSAGLTNDGVGNVFLGISAGMYAKDDNLLYIENSSSESPLIWGDFARDIVNINGSFGINNPKPSSAFNLGDTNVRSDNYIVFGRRVASGNTSVLPFMGHDSFNDGNDLAFGSGFKGGFSFYTNNSQTGTFSNIRMRIEDGGNVGIGTTTPTEKLEVNGNIKAKQSVVLENQNVSAGFRLDQVNSALFIGDVSDQDISTYLIGYGFDENANSVIKASDGYISFDIEQSTIMRMEGGKVGIGTTTPDEKLSVNGKIHAKEVRVDLIGWPDYVFNNDYLLPTIQEVEDHINTNGHLINIPSAKDVEEKGILLGEMNAKLLEKIEELTLYTIQQQKELEAQKDKNNQLEARLSKIESLLSKSEKD
jgi:hypothetical protein